MPNKDNPETPATSGTNPVRHSTYRRSIVRKIKSAHRFLLRAQKQLDLCLQATNKRAETELLSAYRAQIPPRSSAWTLYNPEGEPITYRLDPAISLNKQIDQRFKKVRKWELGIPYAQLELEKAKKALAQWTQLLLAYDATLHEEEKNALVTPFFPHSPRPSTTITAAKSKPYREFFSPTHIPIWVGKGAQANHELTFSYAHGNYTWLHAAETPGAHVVICTDSAPDEETLQESMRLALQYSQAKNRGETHIVITKVKHVRPVTGHPGKVHIAKPTYRFFRIK